ncbi:MAG TPA: OmpA family protein [Cellvibrionaceae bacterium]
MYKQTLLATSLAAVLITGCASTPEGDDRAEQLRNDYEQLVAVHQASDYAPIKTKEAEEELLKLERLINNKADDADIEHQVFIARRKLDTAEQNVRMKKADEFIEQSDSRRDELIIAARTRDATEAQSRAEAMTREAQLAQQRAEAMAREAQSAQRRAEQEAERARLADERAEKAEALAAQMQSRAEALESEIKDLSTQQTDRGLVLTLGNILFEFDKAEVKSGAGRTLERVAQFLNEYPDRKVMVEGFTDNVGSSSYNEDLSDRRARAIKEKLVASGVDSDRVSTRGYGSQHPVASNDSESGRLQNRRVEIIIAEQGENVSDR